MTAPTIRIPPLEPPYTPEITDMLEKWMPPGVALEPLALFRVLARNPDLMSRMRPLGAGILGGGSPIDPAEREIVIDRTCARLNCEYEWGVHVAAFGPALGLSPETLNATASAAPDDPVWTPRQSLLVRLVDELTDTHTVSDALWRDLTREWDTAQLLHLIVTAGWYHVIAFVANAAGLAPETWAARFPT
jgi:alkylhydroperoxidase family enzyme